MKVSVIVPVYNVKKYLKKCLDSLVNQTMLDSDIEIILVDDGSFDGSEKICDEYILKYRNFKCIHTSNKGQSSARNIGLEIANGEWIGFVDSDDFVDVNYYEQMYNFAVKNNSDMICSNRRVFSEQGEKVYETDFASDYTYKVVNRSDYFFDKFFTYTPSVCNKLYRSDIIKNVRFFSVDYVGSEDTLFNFELIKKLETVSEICGIYYNSTERKKSTARSYKPNDVLKNYNLFRELNNVSLNDDENLKIQSCIFLYFQQRIWYQISKFSKDSQNDILETIMLERSDKDYYKFTKKILCLKYRFWNKMGYRLTGMLMVKFYYLLKLINLKLIQLIFIKKYFL